MKYNAGKDNSQWVESPIKSEEVLREELFVNKLSYQKIADKYGVSKRTVARYVKKFNIKIDIKERLSETRNYKGENHPQWKGGRRYKKCPKCGEVDISFVANSCIPCRDISGEKNGMFGKRHTEEAKEAISSKNKGNTHWVNKIHTEESKKKMRLSAIERISTNVYNGGQVKPNYNPKACEVYHF